jgi:D-alanyl-D-alanine carboxypeptidase
MLRELHLELGIPSDYDCNGARPRHPEAADLVDVGPNLVGQMQQLTESTATKWQAMITAASADGIALLLVSGFRSIDYQARLIRKKINAGQGLSDILTVNAAPGYSEHHSGRAIDIATPGSRPLTEDFETSDAFAWLRENAENFGFGMSYPRGNAQGFVYEPWHWAQSPGEGAESGAA